MKKQLTNKVFARIKRLFKTETNYYKATKKIRIYESYLKNKGTAEITEKYDSFTLVFFGSTSLNFHACFFPLSSSK
jgi:hypothetical protein